MDKYEYRVKTEQMLEYAEKKQYKKAMEIADTIDWRRIKNGSMLASVSEIYENVGEYRKAKDILFIAYDKAPGSRKTVYHLGLLALKTGDTSEAMDCYEEFVKLAPKDPNQYILRYKILKAQKAPLEQQIEALEEFKHAEYVEKWAYELARLYHEAGMTEECLEECDDLILWFSEGKYVYQAMELKMKYKPLTPLQQEKYDSRVAGEKSEAVRKKPMFKKPKERPVPDPRISRKIRENVHVTGSIDLPELPEPTGNTIEAELDSLPDERPQTSRPRTKIESTSDIMTTITGANLADVLKAGVAVASGVDPATVSGNDNPEVTGQMRIEEILAGWEETQRENAKIIEKNQEELDRKKAKQKKEKEASGNTKTILTDDIRRLMEELESGAEPSDDSLFKEDHTDEPEREDELDFENMGNVVESLQLSDDDEYEEDSEYDDDEYEEDSEYDEDEYEEDSEYDEDEYEEDSEYDDDEYEEDEYEEDSEYDEDEYEEDSEYGEDEYEEDSEYDDEESEDDSEDREEEYEADSEYADGDEDDSEENSEHESMDEGLAAEEQAAFEERINLKSELADELEALSEETGDEAESMDLFSFQFEDGENSDGESEKEAMSEKDFGEGSEKEAGSYEEEAEDDEGDEEEYDDEVEDKYEDEEEYEDEVDDEYEDEEEYEDEVDDEYEDEEEYEDEGEYDDEYDEEEYDEEEYDEEEYDEEEYDEEEYDDEYDEEEYDDGYEDEADDDDEYIDAVTLPEPEPEPKRRPKKAKKSAVKKEEVLEIEEPSEAEITARMEKFDTGFVVQGRYDLSATSEIGLRMGLTEEQKKLFSYFVPIRGVSEQIVEILNNDKHCRNRYGTSRTGNIVVIGRKGSGKTVLAVDLVKAIQKQRKLKQGRVAIVTGESLNKKELTGIIDKLQGGALIIEKAAKMNARTIRELNELMEEQTGEMLFVLEEQRKPLERMFAANPEFKKKFTSRMELPVFINDELVTFGQTYAKENGYRIDEMGILALYSRIDMMQREDHAVTVAEVKEIMDEAIEHSQKANVKHLVKRVFGKSTDESDRIILKEEDFKL